MIWWKECAQHITCIWIWNSNLHFLLFPHVSGNTDAVIPVTSTRYSIDALKLPTVSPWRAWYDDGEVSDIICFMTCLFSPLLFYRSLRCINILIIWVSHNKQVGGWIQEYAGLTFINVRGAGHEVPLHRPKLALTMFKAFLAGTSLPALEPDLHTAYWSLCLHFLPFVSVLFTTEWIFPNNILGITKKHLIFASLYRFRPA